ALSRRRTECAGEAGIHGDAAGEALAAGAKERIGEGGLQIAPRPERQGTTRADGQGPSDAHLCSAPGRDTPVDTGSTVAQVPACLCVDRLQTSLAGPGRDKTGVREGITPLRSRGPCPPPRGAAQPA